jgi:SAM-dependent methyltransferase
MPPNSEGRGDTDSRAPSMLDLVRLSPKPLFPPGGADLYRQIALLADMGEGDEVLDVACGKGVSLAYFVTEYGVHGSGVDVDGRLIDEAEVRTREEGLSAHLQFQTGASDHLPYRDEIFDVAVGELGLAAHCEAVDAVRELVRVTKPGGVVILVQLVWKAPVDEARQRVLAEHLGAKPLMLVEWKRLLREAGVEDLHTEDWSDDETAFRPRVAKPFPDFAEIFTVPEKIGILRRAWSRWGWGGVRAVLEREAEVHRLLTRERILGLDLIKGRKPARAVGGETEPAAEPDTEPVKAGAEPPEVTPEPAARSAAPTEDPSEPDTEETAGLPLFGGTDDDPSP